MFNLINSQVYELQQHESLLNLEIKQQQQQQQQQNQLLQLNSKNRKNSNAISNTDMIDGGCGSKNIGAYNCKSLNNLTNLITNTNSNNSSSNNRKTNKSNYGSYYRQEKLRATANFIEKFLKSETADSSTNQSDINIKQNNNNMADCNMKQQQQNCHNPIINFTYTYQTLNELPPSMMTSDLNRNKEKKQRQRNYSNYCDNKSDKIKFNSSNTSVFYDNNIVDNNDNHVDDDEDDDDDDNRSDITEMGPNSLQLDQLNSLLDKNSSDTMPSLSPSQSSTDQSTSTTTTTATTSSSSKNNNSSSSSSANNGGISSSSAVIATNGNNDEIIGGKKSSTNSVLHRKKLLKVVSFLDQQNQRLEKELQNEKTRRQEELSRIVKSLLYFEAKLKSEKKVINQKLFEKDDEIARLVRTNRKLQEKLKTVTADEVVEDSSDRLAEEECKYPEALFCSNCRKDFYGLNEKCDIWTQTDGKSCCKGDCNNSSNNQHSTEHCSSSDETLSSSFYGARRSVRYTSKRTFGTFREYMRSRCMNIDDLNIEDDNRSTLSRDGYPNQNGNSKRDKAFSEAIERLHGVRRASSFEVDSSEPENRSRKHKKTFSSSGPETDHEHTNSPNDEGIEDVDDEDDFDEEDEDYVEQNSHIRKSCFKGANVGVVMTTNSREFSEMSVKQEFETSTDDWYASASDAEDEQNSSVCRTKSYGYNAVNPVLECVNQILLQQSMEECVNEKVATSSSGTGENYYDNNCAGPTSLESNENLGSCLSNGASSNSGKENHSGSGTGNANGTGPRKRVHFSTKNSMVHVPRDDDDIGDQKSCTFSDVLETSMSSEHHSSNLNYESIYSNEYEPIGSENNSSNLYVDMESKLDQDERQNSNKCKQSLQNQSKQPPALPPKPANLIKFKRGNKVTSTQSPLRQTIDTTPTVSVAKLTKELLEKVNSDKNEKYGSEPDYCSISEVNIAIKTMQIVADVHKSNDTNSASSVVEDNNSDDAMSDKTCDEDEEIFADVPKLPNVAAIIAPPSKNKSPKSKQQTSPTHKPTPHISTLLQQKQQQLQQNRPQTLQIYRPKSPGQVQRKHVPNILAEINKKIQQANLQATASLQSSPAASPNKINSNFILPIQSPTKRNQSTNQLLPILKSPSSSLTGNSITNTIVNTKNYNNILLSTQNINLSTTTAATNFNQKSHKSIDTNKLQSQQKTSSSPKHHPQQQQSQRINKNVQQQQTKIEEHLPLEAEFDWYNLDAEYCKSSNRPDIVKAADVLNGCLDEYILANSSSRLSNQEMNQSVEYNLDEEFSLSNQPDIIKENIRPLEDRKLETIPGSESESVESSPKKSNKRCSDQSDDSDNLVSDDEEEPVTVVEEIKLSNDSIQPPPVNNNDNSKEALTILNKFPTICDQTPCRQSVNISLKPKNFVEFIDNAGLSTKSLPQQRKIIYTGPFV